MKAWTSGDLTLDFSWWMTQNLARGPAPLPQTASSTPTSQQTSETPITGEFCLFLRDANCSANSPEFQVAVVVSNWCVFSCLLKAPLLPQAHHHHTCPAQSDQTEQRRVRLYAEELWLQCNTFEPMKVYSCQWCLTKWWKMCHSTTLNLHLPENRCEEIYSHVSYPSTAGQRHQFYFKSCFFRSHDSSYSPSSSAKKAKISCFSHYLGSFWIMLFWIIFFSDEFNTLFHILNVHIV